jgi:hypothetical protein
MPQIACGKIGFDWIFGLQNDQLYPAQNVVFAMVFAAKFEPDPFHGKLPDF